MGYTNQQVAEAWKKGIARKSANGNLRTDGSDLYSYKMKIGATINSKKVVLLALGFSRSTTGHVNEALRVADDKVSPVWKQGVNSAIVGWVSPELKTKWALFPHDAYGVEPSAEIYPRLYLERVTQHNVGEFLLRYETDGLSLDQEAELFRYLLNSGMINILQGHYHRRAKHLINVGRLVRTSA